MQPPSHPAAADTPFIYRNSLSGTVCQMLGIGGQVAGISPDDSHIPQGIIHAMETTYFFPASIEVYNYTSAADPKSNDYWSRRATLDGVELGVNELPSPFLVRSNGLTAVDQKNLIASIIGGLSMERVYT
jgi:hypothetical protein